MVEQDQEANDGMGTRSVAVFADWPRPGRVLPRMSPALPAAEACRLYQALLADALAAARGSAARRVLVYWADVPEEEREWLRVAPAVETRRQYGPDPGVRLRDAFTALLEAPGDRAVIIGTDCPMLDPNAIGRAFAALASVEVALGPALGGGMCLVGLSRPAPALFEGFAWDGEDVLDGMRGRAAAAGMVPALLEPLERLDTPERLVRLLARAVSPPPLPPLQTIGALRELGLLPGEGTA
jgi:hypothetical protein